MHKCPDEECQAKVMDLLIDTVAKNRLMKWLGIVFALFGAAVIGAAILTWADNRANPKTYSTIKAVDDAIASSIARDELIKIKQAETDRDIKYLILMVEEIKNHIKKDR